MVLDTWIIQKEEEERVRPTRFNQSRRVFETTFQEDLQHAVRMYENANNQGISMDHPIVNQGMPTDEFESSVTKINIQKKYRDCRGAGSSEGPTKGHLTAALLVLCLP
jgi:hypothetical protein